MTEMKYGKGKKIKMTEAQYRAADNDYQGICLACGEDAFSVEPDARKYTCEACEQKYVYGIQELLIMDKIEFIEASEVDE